MAIILVIGTYSKRKSCAKLARLTAELLTPVPLHRTITFPLVLLRAHPHHGVGPSHSGSALILLLQIWKDQPSIGIYTWKGTCWWIYWDALGCTRTTCPHASGVTSQGHTLNTDCLSSSPSACLFPSFFLSLLLPSHPFQTFLLSWQCFSAFNFFSIYSCAMVQKW